MLQTHTHTHTEVLSHSKGFVCLHSYHNDPIGTGVEASLLNTHAHPCMHRLVHTDRCISWSSLASACTGGCWDHEPVKTQCWITQFQLISFRSLISSSIQVLSASTVLLETFFLTVTTFTPMVWAFQEVWRHQFYWNWVPGSGFGESKPEAVNVVASSSVWKDVNNTFTLPAKRKLQLQIFLFVPIEREIVAGHL